MSVRPFLLCLLLAAAVGLPAARAQQSQQAQQQQQQQDARKKPETEAPEAQDQTISVETNLVVLNVTVTDFRGKYVSGLKLTDFKLFEDGVQQKIQSLNADQMPFASAILLDTSGSMEGKMAFSRSACATFIDGTYKLFVDVR